MIRILVILLLLAGLWSTPAPGQSLRFERLSVENGLSQGSVTAIMQDSRGFMWFGTQTGIDRYDGYRFKSFKRVPLDTTAYRGGFAISLFEDASGYIWVGTTAPVLARFDPTREAFRFFDLSPYIGSSGVASIAATGDGTLWLGTNRGLARFDPSSGSLKLLGHREADSRSLSAPVVTHVHRTSDGVVWAATPFGLNRLADEAGLFDRFLIRRPHEPEEQSRIWHIYGRADESHILWLSTDAGLVRFDSRDGSHRRFLPDPAEPEANVIEMASSDPLERHVLWLTTGDGGLLRFDESTGTFTRFRHDGRNPHSLGGDNTGAIYTDRSGIIWVGHPHGRGISKFDPTVNSIRHYRAIPGEPNSLSDSMVMAIAEDEDDVFYFGTVNGGVTRFDRRDGTYTHYRHDPRNRNSIASDYVRAIVRSRDGMIWIGTDRGLNRLDPATGRITHFTHDPNDPRSLGADFIRRIYEDRSGTLWVGALGTLNRFDPDSETFTRYAHDPADPYSLPPNSLLVAMAEDHAGNFWLGMGGLVRFDVTRGRVADFYRPDPRDSDTPAGMAIWTIHERAREPGVLWLAAYDGALSRFETRAGTFRHFSERDGLANDVLYGIVEDDEGRLWMSSNRGISRFDPETETFRNYGLDSGLQGLEFNAAAYHKSATGEVFFGGIGGVNSFFPHQLRDNENAPQVVLTGLKLFNRPLAPGSDSPLKGPLVEAEEVRLRHRQNMLTFEFAALHYRDPSRNTYAYQLEGLDQEWVLAPEQRLASYANLAPGNYTFRVRAANSDGVWNEEGVSLRIVVLPPWWRTGWAYGMYFLAICVGVATVDRAQRRRLVARERERARQRELEQAREIERAYRELKRTQAQLVQQEKLASLGQLTAGIAHEIKNPLNFVNNFAALNQELAKDLRQDIADERPYAELGELAADFETNSAKIAEHGRRADDIVRSMLEHSRGGKGERERVDINALVEEYVNLAYHGKRAQNGEVDVLIERAYSPEAGQLEVVSKDLGRVILNLVGNAWDAVAERAAGGGDGYRPLVRVSTARSDGAVEIRVADNGPGIPEELRQRIFEPFFTTKPAGSGTGLGLSLSHEIVTQGHGGSLAVESDPGSATEFVVALPAH